MSIAGIIIVLVILAWALYHSGLPPFDHNE